MTGRRASNSNVWADRKQAGRLFNDGGRAPTVAPPYRITTAMELHVAGQPGRKTTGDGLIRAIKRADAVLARCSSEETYLDCGTAYVQRARPAVAAANLAMELRIPAGSDAEQVIARLLAHFAAAGVPCHSLDANDADWPAELPAAAMRHGYRPVKRQVLELRNATAPAAGAAVQVIPGRAALAEVAALHRARALAMGVGPDAAGAIADTCLDHLDDPRIDVLLARAQRKPVGLVSVLTLGNIGVVLDLFSDASAGPDIRPTLAARLLEHCQRSQFEQVIIGLGEGDDRLAFVESLGFEPVAQFERYVQG